MVRGGKEGSQALPALGKGSHMGSHIWIEWGAIFGRELYLDRTGSKSIKTQREPYVIFSRFHNNHKQLKKHIPSTQEAETDRQ